MSKAYVIVTLMIVASLTGCLDDLFDDNEIPLAKIENSDTFYILECETVAGADRTGQKAEISLSGTGYDSDGIIWGYEWRSNIDGVLGKEENITISGLSTGNHTISFKAQDEKGKWSKASSVNIEVLNGFCPTGGMMATEDGSGNWTIQIAKANPQITLENVNWEIVDDERVSIANDLVSNLTNYNDEGVDYIDKDDDGEVSSNDEFRICPDQGYLSGHSDLSGYLLFLTYVPTGEPIGYGIGFNR